ncbi:MAG: 16S rRNA (uracil(1498)-N(3))-methyltransferase [Desulfonatronovibrio sp.]
MYQKISTFFLEPGKWQEPFILTDAEAHHLARVLRVKPGQKVRLINGQGLAGVFTVQKISKRQVSLSVEETRTWPEPLSKVYLALAWNKSFRRSWLLEKAVELGVWKIILWQARHSQGRTKDAVQDNWQAKMIAGAKQCENPWLPGLEFIHGGIDELIDRSKDLNFKILLWEEENRSMLMDYYQRHRPEEKIIVVGPEGGLAQEEVNSLTESGFTSLSLGPRVLRWETAALAPLFLDMLFFPEKKP